MIYKFKIEEELRIIDHFGNEFFTKVKGLLESLTSGWKINELQLINSFSANLVFKGVSTIHGPVVMKFVRENHEFMSEFNALNYFHGSSACKLIDVDIENKVLLEESIFPGIELVLEKQIEKRLDVFCNLYQQLHSSNNKRVDLSCDKGFCYKSYKDWIFGITAYMEQKRGWKEAASHMKRAKEVYLQLSQKYEKKTLLHGDFHYYNILKGENGYVIIDPKGVIGDPIFDIPRYILNEFWDEEDKTKVDETIDRIFNIIGCKLNLTREVLSKLIYIEGTMAICWNIEDGAKIEEKTNFLDTLNKLAVYME